MQCIFPDHFGGLGPWPLSLSATFLGEFWSSGHESKGFIRAPGLGRSDLCLFYNALRMVRISS